MRAFFLPLSDAGTERLKQFTFAWLLLLAFCLPVSIAAASLALFPFIIFYILGARWTFRLWPPTWSPMETAFAIFWGISLISALAGANPWHSRIRLSKDLYAVLLIILGALVRQTPGLDRKLLRIFLWGGLATALFGILQHFVGIDRVTSTDPLQNVSAAWAHAPQAFLGKLALINGRSTGLRGHPLTFAETLLLPLGYTLSLLALCSRESWWKAAVAQGILLLALVYSQSRGPWLAFAVMTLATLAIEPRAYVLRRIVAVMIPVLLVISAPTLKHRLHLIADPTNGSNAERLQMWSAGARIVKEHPLLGVGAGSMPLVSAHYQTPEEHATYGDWGHLHNTYINIAAERGLLGLFAFLGFVGYLGWTLFWTHRSLSETDPERRLVVLSAFIGLLGWGVSGLTESVYTDSSILMMFYFVQGLARASCKN
jgi:O-antigen ligase